MFYERNLKVSSNQRSQFAIYFPWMRQSNTHTCVFSWTHFRSRTLWLLSHLLWKVSNANTQGILENYSLSEILHVRLYPLIVSEYCAFVPINWSGSVIKFSFALACYTLNLIETVESLVSKNVARYYLVFTWLTWIEALIQFFMFCFEFKSCSMCTFLNIWDLRKQMKRPLQQIPITLSARFEKRPGTHK